MEHHGRTVGKMSKKQKPIKEKTKQKKIKDKEEEIVLAQTEVAQAVQHESQLMMELDEMEKE